MTNQAFPTRWGDFVLRSSAVGSAPPIEGVGPARDAVWPEGVGPWEHPLPVEFRDESSARGNSFLPFPEFVPAGEQFLAANLIQDGPRVVDAAVAYMRSGIPLTTSPISDQPGSSPTDRTLLVGYTGRYNRPAGIYHHVESVPVNGIDPRDATVFEDEVQLVEVQGNRGILRTWRSVDQDLYLSRLPSVIVNWFNGPWFWSLQSSFLTTDEALEVANSIRPVELRS